MPVVGEAIVRVRVRSTNLPGDIRDEVQRGARGADRDADAAGRRIGSRVEQGFAQRFRGTVSRVLGNDINSSRGGLNKLFGRHGRGLASELASEFRLGLGAGRPGPAIVSMLALATPSAFGAAAAMGVAIAGAMTAALSSALLTGGLLAAAFAAGKDILADGLDRYKEFGRAAGETIARGMADGFNRSSSIIQDRLLPAIEGPLSRAGELLGNMFTNLADTLTIPENLSRIGQILDNNNRFIERFDVGLQGLTSAFLTLFAASKPMIDLIGDRFAEFGQWAASALSAAEANGSLAIVMDKLTRLADGFFDAVAKVGPAFGDWLLNLDVDGMLAGWSSFGGLLSSIGGVFGEIADGAGPHFVAIMDNLARIFNDMVASGVLETVADRIGTLLERFTGFIASVTDSDLGGALAAAALALGLFGGFISPIITLLSSLGSAFGFISGAIGVAIGPILLIAGIFAAIWTQSERFRTAITDLATAVGGKFMEIWDELSPKLEPLVTNFLRLAEVIGDRLAPIIEALTPVFLTLLDVIGTVLGFIIEQVGEFFGFLADVLSGDFEGAWDHLKTMFGNLVEFIGNILGHLKDFVFSIFSGIADIAIGIWDSIYAKVESWWDNTESLFHTVVQFFIDTFNSVKDWVVGIWDSITSTVSEEWNTFIAQIQETGQGFVDWWNNLWAWVEGIVRPIWEGITGFISDTWNQFTTQLAETGEGLKAWWNNLWTWVSDTTMTIWNGIWAFFETVLTAISNAVTTAGTWIQTAWNTMLNWVRDTAIAVWNSVWAFFESVLTSIADAVRNAGTWIQTAWNNALTWVRDTAVNIWNSIWAFFESVLSSIAGVVRNAGTWIQTAWNNTLTWVYNTAVNIWNNVLGFLERIWSSIEGAASSAFQAVYDAIVQPIIDAYNAVTGWISSIKDAVSGALDWLSGQVGFAGDQLNTIIATQSQAGAVTANMFNADAVGGTPAQIDYGRYFPALFAKGGTVAGGSGGIAAVVGEGRNDERIEPLDSSGLSRRDRAMIESLVGMMTGGPSSDAPINVHIQVGEQQLTDFTTRVVRDRETQLARRVAQGRRRG